MSNTTCHSATELLRELMGRNFAVRVNGDNVEVKPKQQLSIDDCSRIKIHKTKIIAVLSPCNPHVDPSQWERTPLDDRPGWEKAECRRCGKFLGFNPIRPAAVPPASEEVPHASGG
jgi:hypothetical protein